MNKVLQKTTSTILTNVNAAKQFYLILIIGMIGMVSNAQCIGPYARFESFGPAGTVPPSGFTSSYVTTTFTSPTIGTNVANSRSGSFFMLSNKTGSWLKTPAISYAKTFSFYVKTSASATGTFAFTVEYSTDDFATPININTLSTFTLPASVTTSYQLVSATLPYINSTNIKFRITDNTVYPPATGQFFVDDISWDTYTSSGGVSSGYPENTVVAPVSTGNGAPVNCAGGTINVASNAIYNFYDNGGSTDQYNLSQTNQVTFKPITAGDKIKVTIMSYTSAATERLEIWDDDGGNLVAGTSLLNTTATTIAAGTTYSSTISSNGSITIKFTSDGATNAVGFNIKVECPSVSITSLGTSSGCQGDSLVINGTGFTSVTASNVTVGGTAVSSIVSNTGTVLTVIPAPGSTGAVSVTNGATVSFGTYTVNPLPTVTAGASVCVGSTITLSPTTGGTWASSDATKATVTNAGVVTGVAAGSATFTFTNTTTGCSATTSSVTVNALPVVSAGASVCVGTTITLSPTTGGTWASSDNTKATITNAGVVTGVAAGNVTFTFTNTTTNCSATTSSVSVNAAPVNTLTTTAPQSYCLNAVATPLSVTATTSAGVITGYQWYSNTVASTSGSTLISGETNSTLTPLTTAAGTTYYYCIATNTAGCSTTSAISGAVVVSNSLTPPTATAATSIGGSTFTANWNAVAGVSSYYLDVSTVNTFATFVSGYNNLLLGNVTTYPISGLTQGTTYYYRVRAVNSCITSADSNIITVTTLTLTYCSTTYTNGTGATSGDAITRVVLGTLNNASSGSTSPFYTFYNAVTIPNLYQNSTSSISVSFGADARQYLGVWIDFNQNGTFETTEGVVSTNNAGGGGTSTLTITVPAGALLGNTRMRVRGGDDAAMTTGMPCGVSNSTWGETEDYIVNIVPVPACSVAVPTGLAISFITGTTATLSWSDASFAPSSTYEFAYNTTGTTPTSGTILTGAMTTNLSGLTTGLTYYCWVRSNCGGSNQSAWAGPINFVTVNLDVINLNSSTTGGSTTSCNAKFYDSGSSTGTYSNNENYTYTFVPASAGAKLKAVFNSFALESNYDFLSIYNGTTVSAANLIGTYTATQIAAGQTFYSTAPGGELTFKFTSDISVTLSGWDVSLTCVTVPTITSFSPTTACAGATPVVTITGTDLTGVTTVSFNGVTAVPTTVTATSITVTLPATAVTGPVSVSTATATGTSTSSFVVKPIPGTPNAGADTSVCIGSSVTLNAAGSISNQTIVQSSCNTLAGWINNDSAHWLSVTSNIAGGAASGELRFNFSPSVVTDSWIYLNQLINTTGYTSLNLAFNSRVDWFSGTFNLYAETSPDGVTWTPRWNIAPTADIAAGIVNVNLAALNGTSFYIRFRFNGDSFNINNWYIDDVTLSGVPTLTYSWAANATLSSTTIYNPVATPTTDQTYTVSTSLNGCASALSDSVLVVVNAKPTSVLSGTQSICNGATANLSVALTGIAPWSITYFNGSTSTTVSGILTSPYTITTPALSSATTYTITALSDSKCSAVAGGMTGSATVSIITPPTVTAAASAASVCFSFSSQTTTLAYSATTGSPATYSIVWGAGYSPAGYVTVTDAPFPLTPSGTISVTVPPGADNSVTNTATLIVKNAQGCVSASYPFTLTINISPAVTITTPLSTKTVCYSAASQLVSYSYSGANVANSYDLTWNPVPANSLPTLSNVPFPSNTGTIDFTIPAGTAGGTYTGTVTPKNAGCGVGAAPRTITLVVSAPSITPAASATGVCISTSAQTTTLSYSNAIATPTTYSIVWNAVPANSFVAVTDAPITASPITINVPANAAANTYTGTISVKNANGCVSPNTTFTVKVNGKPTFTSSLVIDPLCVSTSVQSASLGYNAITNAPTSYSIDWDSTANAAGLLDQGVTAYPFVNSDDAIGNIVITANTPANQYFGTMTIFNAAGCSRTYSVSIAIGKKWNGITSSDWATASNWTPSGEPTSSDYCVIIPAGTPNSPVISTDAFSGDLTINTGATVTVNSGFVLEVQDAVVTNGTLTVNNNASLVQINDVPNSGTGNLTYNRDVSALHGYDYIYWSSPVTAQPITSLYTTPPMGFKFYWDTLVDNLNGASGNVSQGNWVPESGNMNVGQGYIVRASSGYGWSGNLTSTFTGIPNNGTLTIPAHRGSYQGALPYIGVNGKSITKEDDNYNLIGNPYPSSIDAISFLNANSNIDGYVYLWTHGTTPSSSSNPFYGSFSSNYYLADYLIYNYLGSSSVPSFNGKIATGQGFFVTMLDGPTVTNSSSLITFDNTMRSSAYTNSQFYKSSQNNAAAVSEKHRIWIDLIDSNNAATRTLVGYATGASNNKDRNFDAYTPVGNANIIYSRVDNENVVIQGRSLPFDENDQVSLGYHSSANGNFTIAIATADGLFEQGQAIYLEDKLLNVIHDLRQAPYNFTSTEGTFNDRFVLRYTNSALSVNQNTSVNVAASITNNQLQIKANDTIDSVQVFDITGKLIKSYNSTQKTTDFKEEFLFEKGVYLAKIKLTNGTILSQKLMN